MARATDASESTTIQLQITRWRLSVSPLLDLVVVVSNNFAEDLLLLQQLRLLRAVIFYCFDFGLFCGVFVRFWQDNILIAFHLYLYIYIYIFSFSLKAAAAATTTTTTTTRQQRQLQSEISLWDIQVDLTLRLRLRLSWGFGFGFGFGSFAAESKSKSGQQTDIHICIQIQSHTQKYRLWCTCELGSRTPLRY